MEMSAGDSCELAHGYDQFAGTAHCRAANDVVGKSLRDVEIVQCVEGETLRIIVQSGADVYTSVRVEAEDVPGNVAECHGWSKTQCIADRRWV